MAVKTNQIENLFTACFSAFEIKQLPNYTHFVFTLFKPDNGTVIPLRDAILR